MPTSITTRRTKGSALTHDEMDDNLENLATTADAANAASVPVGGTAGQVLAKASATDYDTQWVAGGGGGSGLSSGLLFAFHGSTPTDELGCFSANASGGLTSAVEPSGPMAGRSVYVLNGTDAGIVLAAEEELRIVDSYTVGAWLYLDEAVDLTLNDYYLYSCIEDGENLTNNVLYSAKTTASTNGAYSSFHEYGSGQNVSIDFSIHPPVGEWFFLALSRLGGQEMYVTQYRPAIGIFEESSAIFPVGAAKDMSLPNTQQLYLYRQKSGTYFRGKSAGIALWNRALSRYERRSLKDDFFSVV